MKPLLTFLAIVRISVPIGNALREWIGCPLLLAVAMSGCHFGASVSIKSEPFTPDVKFRGTPADSLVVFDLDGEWDVFRYQFNMGDKPSEGRWERNFRLHRDKELGILAWRDEGNPNYFRLTTKMPQFLHWGGQHGETWFSINQHSFGVLELTGDDGLFYMAIRKEGGQDLPPLEYPQ